MDVLINSNFPGGNVSVKEIDGHHVKIAKDMRDTPDWFYWCFSAHFKEPGTYTFTFVDGPSIGTRGPAVSFDSMMTWRWLGVESVNYKNESFEYICKKPDEKLIFCVSMQYLQYNLDVFLKKHEFNNRIRRNILCLSRHGREVELLRISSGTGAKKSILLCSRHHSCEMMATHVLEGFMGTLLDDLTYSEKFLNVFDVYVIPFVDKDGVEEGDQGKCRFPHDHARDYGELSIYPEVSAIKNLILADKIDVVIDLHCPWLRSPPPGTDEYIYFVGLKNQRIQSEVENLSAILEKEVPSEMPFWAKDNVSFGTSWNTAENYKLGNTLCLWASELPFVKMAASMEIPYANIGEHTITVKNANKFGSALNRSLLKWNYADKNNNL